MVVGRGDRQEIPPSAWQCSDNTAGQEAPPDSGPLVYTTVVARRESMGSKDSLKVCGGQGSSDHPLPGFWGGS